MRRMSINGGRASLAIWYRSLSDNALAARRRFRGSLKTEPLAVQDYVSRVELSIRVIQVDEPEGGTGALEQLARGRHQRVRDLGDRSARISSADANVPSSSATSTRSARSRMPRDHFCHWSMSGMNNADREGPSIT